MSKQTYILKPGVRPTVIKEGKTNLQLREMQMLQTVLADGGIEAKIISIPEFASQALNMGNSHVIIFNSAPIFDEELRALISCLMILEGISITFISNDCRLNFINAFGHSVAKQRFLARVEDGMQVNMLTNASYDLESYSKLVWTEDIPIQIQYAPLYALPAFLPLQPISHKTVFSVFTCMHFSDYSKERQEALQYLKHEFGDELVVTGDMTGLLDRDGNQVKSIVTDTKHVLDWYTKAMITPVLLEPKYQYHAVTPNRVAEAIVMRCMPIVYMVPGVPWQYTNDTIELPTAIGMTNMVSAMQNYCNQYESAAVQSKLDRLQILLQLDKMRLVSTMQKLCNIQ